ncbi:MAG: hypothetical protein IJV31_11270 [Clostridia bacterium]|nr:hypothetical protein [Clostridia bacterium]
MFICNVHVNGNKVFKWIIAFLAIVVLIIFGFAFYKIFVKNGVIGSEDFLNHSDVTEISPENYTNILKASHDNIDNYVGKEIKFSGYVYRVYDFSDNQFVLARDMLVDNQSVVVGFLSEFDNISSFEDGSWIEIVGTITKGKYHNQSIPIVKVKSAVKVNCPEDSFVPPPSDSYIPTSSML